MKSVSLKNKTAIVTGASRGIGLAIAKALAREGVRLGLLSRSKPGIGGEFVACDLAELDKIPGAVRQLVDRLGTVDFLINNAGIFLEKPVPEIQLADWERVLRVNVTAPFLITREILPQMIARRQGRIINIGSTSGSQGYLHQSAYCASKHALLGFARVAGDGGEAARHPCLQSLSRRRGHRLHQRHLPRRTLERPADDQSRRHRGNGGVPVAPAGKH